MRWSMGLKRREKEKLTISLRSVCGLDPKREESVSKAISVRVNISWADWRTGPSLQRRLNNP